MTTPFDYTCAFSLDLSSVSEKLFPLLYPEPVSSRYVPISSYPTNSCQYHDNFTFNYDTYARHHLLPGCRVGSTSQLAINSGSISILETAIYIHNSYDVFVSEGLAHSCSYHNLRLRNYLKSRWPQAHNAAADNTKMCNVHPFSGLSDLPKPLPSQRYSFVINWHDDWLNYWHWHFECLPRFLILEQAVESLGITLSDIDFFIVGCTLSTTQLLTLTLFGIDLQKLHHVTSALYLQNVIHILSPIPASYSPYIVHLLKSRLSLCQYNPVGKLYIKRGDMARNGRLITNEGALCAALNHEQVYSCAMSSAKPLLQQQLFSSASLVIAPHGSSLTNLLYMPPGGLVIELCTSNYMPDHDMMLGKCLGIRVLMLDTYSSSVDSYGNFSVNLPQFLSDLSASL